MKYSEVRLGVSLFSDFLDTVGTTSFTNTSLKKLIHKQEYYLSCYTLLLRLIFLNEGRRRNLYSLSASNTKKERKEKQGEQFNWSNAVLQTLQLEQSPPSFVPNAYLWDKRVSATLTSTNCSSERWSALYKWITIQDWNSLSVGWFHQECMHHIQNHMKKSKVSSIASGVFYTKPHISNQVIQRITDSCPPHKGFQESTICDPACGCGFFLIQLTRHMRDRENLSPNELAVFVQNNLYGVDIDPLSVEITKMGLIWEIGEAQIDARLLSEHIKCGNALIEDQSYSGNAFSWKKEFPKCISGFDIIIGNPPWMTFSGKHTQEISPALRQMYLQQYTSAQGWLSLSALFIERAIQLLVPKGWLGFIVPIQLCDLEGYRSFRKYLLMNTEPKEPFLVFDQHAFRGISTPSIALITKKRTIPHTQMTSIPTLRTTQQQIKRKDLLERLKSLPKPPKEMFIDCGVHTGNCAKKIIISEKRKPTDVPILEGKDIHSFSISNPRKWLDTTYEKSKNKYFNIRAWKTYVSCTILIRQTAQKPISCLHEPTYYFRNSILGCRGHKDILDICIVNWLNSTIIEWFHRMTIRESSQATFPQIKIRHLRNLPFPKWNKDISQRIANSTIQEHNDILISQMFGISKEDHHHIRKELQELYEKKKS